MSVCRSSPDTPWLMPASCKPCTRHTLSRPSKNVAICVCWRKVTVYTFFVRVKPRGDVGRGLDQGREREIVIWEMGDVITGRGRCDHWERETFRVSTSIALRADNSRTWLAGLWLMQWPVEQDGYIHVRVGGSVLPTFARRIISSLSTLRSSQHK